MQNSGRFYTTSESDREHLWNDSRYAQSEKANLSRSKHTPPPPYGLP